MRFLNQIKSLEQELSPFFLEFKPIKHQMAEILGGIIWILVTSTQWNLFPKELFPLKNKCFY